MTVPSPKIDPRSYEDIVKQIVTLIEQYTGEVKPNIGELRDRTLAEAITTRFGVLENQRLSVGEPNIPTENELIDLIQQIQEAKAGKSIRVQSWRPGSTADAGLALIRIFSRMVKLVSDRLNQVPEKNFLAFLDLIGTQLQPPQPARAALTFSLATGTATDAVVPAYTQVAAPPQEGETEEVVFETDQDLVVTPARLQAVFVRDPNRDQDGTLTDCFSDYTLQATGQQPGAFPVFLAEQPIEHSLYLASDELLSGSGSKSLTLIFTLATAENSDADESVAESESQIQRFDLAREVEWAYWDGQSWQTLQPQASTVNETRWTVVLPDIVAPQSKVIDGVEAIWIRTRLTQALPKQPNDLPIVAAIEATVEVNETDQPPNLCFFNTTPLDLSKDFYPFGEQPRFNDTFYIASATAFANPGSTVTLEITLSEGQDPNKNGEVQIAWEFLTNTGWVPETAIQSDESNESKNLTQKGEVTLEVPQNIIPGTVNSVSSYWVRARILKGDYGKGQDAKPPSIQSLRIRYSYQASGAPCHCRTYNDFLYTDPLPTVEKTYSGVTSSSDTVQVLWLTSTTGFAIGDRVRIPATNPADDTHDYEIQDLYRDSPGVAFGQELPFPLPEPGTRLFRHFPLFNPPVDDHPTLYLGFDRPFSQRPITLFAQVQALTPEAASHPESIDKPARVSWQYFSPDGWKPLGMRDETETFAQRGLLQFIGPPDMASRSDFGQPACYWLRASWVDGDFKIHPHLQRMLTNTIWASQARTLTHEVLGSSNGNPDQRFQTIQAPVMPGQQLEIQEGQLPPAPEQQALERQLGTSAITPQRNEAGQLEAVWVRWQEVPYFYGSKPLDRHYRLDHFTGEVQFGNGQQGMIPPLGRNNIRMEQYRTGGGVQGNRAARRITQIKTTIPYIDSVTNLEPAGGGAAQETLTQVQVRGPQQLRHRHRAVAAQDFADMAFAASPEVARARAITPNFEPLGTDKTQSLWLDADSLSTPPDRHQALNTGQVQVLIVPYGEEAQPVPSLGLMERVEDYIKRRSLATLAVEVQGPQWVEVTIAATVMMADLNRSDSTRSAIIQQLNRFLHCLTGGREGQGWDFGRQPHESDIYALIESVPGVDHVQSLSSISLRPLPDTLGSNFLIYPGPHWITLVTPQGGN